MVECLFNELWIAQQTSRARGSERSSLWPCSRRDERGGAADRSQVSTAESRGPDGRWSWMIRVTAPSVTGGYCTKCDRRVWLCVVFEGKTHTSIFLEAVSIYSLNGSWRNSVKHKILRSMTTKHAPLPRRSVTKGQRIGARTLLIKAALHHNVPVGVRPGTKVPLTDPED